MAKLDRKKVTTLRRLLKRLLGSYTVKVNDAAAARVHNVENVIPYERAAAALRNLNRATNNVRFGLKSGKSESEIAKKFSTLAKAKKELAKAERAVQTLKAPGGANHLYQPIGAPKVQLRDHAKVVTDFAKAHPDAAEIAGTALGIPVAGAVGYIAGSDEKNGTKKADNEKQSKDASQAADSERSVLGYGVGGALTAAAAAYIASERKNRLRNMLIAGVLGGAGGSGLAYWLNRDRS